jgi:hypothetical protein
VTPLLVSSLAIAALCLFVLYGFVAALACIATNREQFHWWCLVCWLCRTQRMIR